MHWHAYLKVKARTQSHTIENTSYAIGICALLGTELITLQHNLPAVRYCCTIQSHQELVYEFAADARATQDRQGVQHNGC